MTTKTKCAAISEARVGPDAGKAMIAGGLSRAIGSDSIVVRRWLPLTQDAGNGMASHGREPVSFTAYQGPARTDGKTDVLVEIPNASISMTLDDLVEITAALCPPWLLRKKLGL